MIYTNFHKGGRLSAPAFVYNSSMIPIVEAGRMRESKKAVPQTNTSNGSFSKEDIVKLALKIIDEEGVDALSFRRLSKESGYPTMTICNRVSDRSSLLNDVVALMISEIDMKPIPDESWQDNIRRFARENREMAKRHPRAYLLYVSTPIFESPALEMSINIENTHVGQNLPPEMPLIFLGMMHSLIPGFQMVESYAHIKRKDEDISTMSIEALQLMNLFSEETFNRNIEIAIAGFEKLYNLPPEE